MAIDWPDLTFPPINLWNAPNRKRSTTTTTTADAPPPAVRKERPVPTQDKTVRQLRDEGYAVIVWTPEELGNCPRKYVEDASIEQGWIVIECHKGE